mgnify:CR=1 FL=1
MPSRRARPASSTAARRPPDPAAAERLDLLEPVMSAVEVAAARLPDLLADLDPTSVTIALLLPEGEGSAVASLAPLGELGFDVEELVATHEPKAGEGAVTRIPFAPGDRPVRRALVVGVGASTADGSGHAHRRAGATLGRVARGSRDVVLAVPPRTTPHELSGLVEGFLLGGWTVPTWRAQGPTPPAEAQRPATRLLLAADASDAEQLAEAARRASIRVRATLRARCLGLTPSNIKNPAWMAAQCRTLARRHGLTVKVWNERDLAREGFGGLLAVGGGSATPPRLVQLEWNPPGPEAGPDPVHVVLVGKGITFDTGGLDIKPAEGMLAMKTDMMGSAAVAATLAACRDLGVAVRVTGLLALAENAVSGAAYRPSDVVTHYGGTTVEIGNTDAEGRVVLADALAYAVEQLRPDVVVDIATLTGAARVAFARAMAPVFATDDGLRDALIAAGTAEGETLWPLPLPTAYRAALDSPVADLQQISGAHGAGSIMAALFLREFVGQTPWAHLDVAGPGRSDVDAGLLAKGPTGFGTRVLLRWLEGLR